MKTLARLGSAAALLMTVAPAVLVLTGHATLEQNRVWMTVATVLWFALTPIWMKPST